jgi:hypothetical protein
MPTLPEKSPLFQSVIRAFDAAGWEYQEIDAPGQEVLQAGFEAHHTRVDLHVQVFAPVNSLSVVSEASIKVTPIRRSITAELLMRTNQELTVGGFEMNWDTGSVYFRISNVFANGEAADAMLIGGLVRANIVEMDRITPFIHVIEKTPEENLPGMDVARLMLREDLLPKPSSSANG